MSYHQSYKALRDSLPVGERLELLQRREPLHRRIGYLILLTLAAAGGVVLAGALLQIAERVWQ